MDILPYQFRFAKFSGDYHIIDSENIGNLSYAYSNIKYAILEHCKEIQFATFTYSSLCGIKGEHVTKVNDFAFLNCTHLTKVTLPNVEHIGSLSFAYCTSLEHVHLLKCKHIGIEGFRYCSKLRNIVLTEKCTIGKLCFTNCSENLLIFVHEDYVDWYKAQECWQPYVEKIVPLRLKDTENDTY